MDPAEVVALRREVREQPTVAMSVWDVMDMVADFEDPAHPGGTPLVHHAFQTAETLRCVGAAEWMVVVGLIHDPGVVLGRLRRDRGQHPVPLTGPTAVARAGSDGLDSCLVTFDHGEYLYEVLRRSPGVRLPELALRVVRYHEFVDWHTHGLYAGLENDVDRGARAVLARFAVADNHSRPPVVVSIPTAKRLRDRYTAMVDRWLPAQLMW
jgi:hypothetical protein